MNSDNRAKPGQLCPTKTELSNEFKTPFRPPEEPPESSVKLRTVNKARKLNMLGDVRILFIYANFHNSSRKKG